MKKQLLYISLFFTLLTNAQSFEKIVSFSPGANTNEYSNAGIESTNGNYIIAINNRLFCLSPNGDSLWTKTFPFYGDITKLFRNNSNQLLAATTLGRMVFLKINENNGDTIGSIKPPTQPSNSGYTIYDALVLPDGDIVYSYNNGGGLGGILRRFTPGSATNKWSNDYAGQNWGPRTICLDDTTLVVSGFRGVANSFIDLYVRKITLKNTTVWSKQLTRKAYYGDRLIGIQKNTAGNYLIATSFVANNILAPAVAVISKNGDSLGVNTMLAYNGTTLNHGYLTSLRPSANGFYAAGYLNFNSTDPTNAPKGMGHMSVLSIDDDGKISSAKAYNKVGFYKPYTSAPFSGTEAWGNGCFLTSDGHYVLYGVGNLLYTNDGGANISPQWRGYVVKSNQLISSVESTSNSSYNFLVYPNPANNVLNIDLTDAAVIQIISTDGKLVYTCNELNNVFTLDISNFLSGIYFVKVTTQKGVGYTKFVKQ